jgi:hypothetical protein
MTTSSDVPKTIGVRWEEPPLPNPETTQVYWRCVMCGLPRLEAPCAKPGCPTHPEAVTK